MKALKILQVICVAGESYRKNCLLSNFDDHLKQLIKNNRSSAIQKYAEAALFSLHNEKETNVDKSKANPTQKIT